MSKTSAMKRPPSVSPATDRLIAERNRLRAAMCLAVHRLDSLLDGSQADQMNVHVQKDVIRDIVIMLATALDQVRP
jgi:hypothetical protein